MDHFDTMRWTDYVRGLMTSPEREVMERHLASGCEACAGVVALIGKIRQEAAREPAVPEHLVQAAKRIFPERFAARAADWLSLPRLAARLIFNSMTDPAIEGARTASEAVVQAVYHAGDYAIEFQIECEPESTRLAVVGQVVNRAAGDEPLAGVPVLLTAGRKQVAAGHSNRFGEFCLVDRVHPGLKLCMPLESIEKRIEIPLTKFMAGLE